MTLDRDITLQRFFLNGDFDTFGLLDGAFALNLNEGFNWTGGRIGNSIINLAKGSVSTISPLIYFLTPSLLGTLNNSGTVNQTRFFDLYDDGTGNPATINNLAGATWNLQANTGINPPQPFGYIGNGGTFNNAGNVIASPGNTPSTAIVLRTTVNNNGNFTIQTSSIGSDPGILYIDHGTASGSFDIAAMTML